MDAPPSDPVVDVAAGGQFSCVAYASGKVSCWGSDLMGQLGADPATVATCYSPEELPVPCRARPTQVPGLDRVVHVVAGVTGACALTGAGEVYCWGSNEYGQLGHPPGTMGDGMCVKGYLDAYPEHCNWTPSKVGGIGPVTALSVGDSTVCAIAGSKAYCWGSGIVLALGQGNVDESERDAPTLVPSLPSDLVEIASSTQQTHTCATSASMGIFCWGYNETGELGHAPGAGTPHDTGLVESPGWANGNPQLVPGTAGMTSVVAATGATCAIAASGGGVTCWGDNGLAQLGNGSITLPVSTPTPSLAHDAVALFGSSSMPMCALSSAGGLSCWGATDTGEIGIGAYLGGIPASSPVVPCDINAAASKCVPTPQTLPGLTFVKASTGEEYDLLDNSIQGGHVLALGTDGVVYGWGANLYGEAGHLPGSSGDAMCAEETSTSWIGLHCAPVPTLLGGL